VKFNMAEMLARRGYKAIWGKGTVRKTKSQKDRSWQGLSTGDPEEPAIRDANRVVLVGGSGGGGRPGERRRFRAAWSGLEAELE
jgi:hypothetical protein